MENKIATLEKKIQSLETVSRDLGDQRPTKIEDKPYAFQCAYQKKWTAAYSIIKLDKLLTTSMSGVTGGFSLSTGEFTVGHSGVWEVTFAMRSKNDSGDEIYAYLFINGGQLHESQYNTIYKDSYGYISSLGSRTLFIKLTKGDKVTLQTSTLTGDALYYNTLCFHLAQPL